MMTAVFALAIALGLYLPAAAIRRAPEPHVHIWVNENFNRFTYPGIGSIDRNPAPIATSTYALTPFWPRYLRCLTGSPWRGQAVCKPDRLLETCEFDRPEIAMRVGGKLESIHVPRPIDAEARLRFPRWFGFPARPNAMY